MRQKKSNWIYYVLGLAVLAAAVFVVLHEVPLQTTHVEEEIKL